MSTDNKFIDDDPDLNKTRQKPPSPTGDHRTPPPNLSPTTNSANINLIKKSVLGATGGETDIDRLRRELLDTQRERDRYKHLNTVRTAAEAQNAPLDLPMDDIVAKLQKATLQQPPRPTLAPVTPATTPKAHTPKVFTTDQERTAFMLQKETDQSNNIVTAISNFAQLAFDGQQERDLRPQQLLALRALTSLLETNTKTINSNEKILQQMVNPNIGKSKQSLDFPIFEETPARHVRHYSVMLASTLKDNIAPFDPDDPHHSDIVLTWDQMKKYGNKHFFDEEDYVEAWGKVTKGEAQQQLYNMIQSKYNLEKILLFWEELYSKHRSITEQQEVIDNFQRKKKESLIAVMLRVTVMIDQMEYAEDPQAWPGIRDKQRRDVLVRVITPNTSMFLKSRREAHERNGYLMKVDEMIQEAHNFEQAHGQVPQTTYPDRTQMSLTTAQMMQIAAWNPKPNWTKPTPMDVDGATAPPKRFMTPPPSTTTPPPQQQNQQQRGRTPDKYGKPYDKNRQKSQSPYRPNSQGPPSRSHSPNNNYRDNRRQSQSPNGNGYNNRKNDYQSNRKLSQENNARNDKRSNSNSSDARRNSQSELHETPALARNPMSSEAGQKALTLNIGDQNQFFQCNFSKLCQKMHVWPKSVPTPNFCPDNPALSKN